MAEEPIIGVPSRAATVQVRRQRPFDEAKLRVSAGPGEPGTEDNTRLGETRPT